MNVELFQLFKDRRFRRGPAIGVVLLFIVANLAVVHWRDIIDGPVGPRRTEQGIIPPSDLNPRTRPIRFDWSIGDRIGDFELCIPDARKTHLAILSGMSQMYTINEYKHGDQTIAEWMDEALTPHGVRVFGLAAPNLSHEEALFILMTTLRTPETKPSWFIFAVAFEKLREVDLRPQFRVYLTKHPEVVAQWREVAMRYRSRYPLATKKMLATLDQLNSETTTAGPKDVEGRLRAAAADVSPLIAERKNLNSHAQGTLFEFRNFIFGINNMTKRPIIPDRYDTNREFLGLLTDVAHEHGTGVIMYIVPFNPRADNPYIPQEYASFKQWLTAFAAQKHVPLANLENAVPAQDWGLFFGGPDFKHFKGDGHRRTAAALVKAFGTQLAQEPSL